MANAIIGHTGFVGGNLILQTKFDNFYNSKNIQEIKGQEFDLLVCSGAPAVKWLANQKPVEDIGNINSLIESLRNVRANKIVLISTIDVYKHAVNVDEDTPIEKEGLHPYGLHRYFLEEFVSDNFDSLVIRLPGLFGEGLKKNIIYDFFHNNMTDKIHQDAVFQFYNLANLWSDIQKAGQSGIKLLNAATEPVSTKEVAKECFNIDFENNLPAPAPFYDFKSKYGKVWGQTGSYLYSKSEILAGMKKFVQTLKKA